MNLVFARLLSQQLAAPQFGKPADVVSWFGYAVACKFKEISITMWVLAALFIGPSPKPFPVEIQIKMDLDFIG